jgi:hypothetical protein
VEAVREANDHAEGMHHRHVQPKTIVDQLAPKVDEFAKRLPTGYSAAIGGSDDRGAANTRASFLAAARA